MNPEELKIEKGIPMPPPRFTGITEVMKRMEIGDSFLIPEGKRTNIKGYADRMGIKIITRKTNIPQKVRVWRTE